MDEKQIQILKKDKEILHELIDFLLKVINPDIEDFLEVINKINKIEKDTFILSKLEFIDILSLMKKIFQIIDRNKSLYYEYKYILFPTLSRLENIYEAYIENLDDAKIEILRNELLNFQNELMEIIKNRNIDKKYYYIKIELDNNIPYFYLSRKTIILNLLEYGKPYNYTPSSLDDDVYSYFILDYKVDKDIDVENIFKKLKEIDDAIINYSIYKIESTNNLYNLKFYIKKEINSNFCLIMDDFKFIDRIHYYNYYDTYVESKNQRYLLEDLFRFNNEIINLISIKKISDREVKIFLPNGLNNDNINEIKNSIKEILIDKNIREIIYSKNLDFKGYQMLEYLNKRYNIEYTSIKM